MLKHTIIKSTSLFAAAAAASFIFSSAAPAQAARALVPASACFVETDYIGDYWFNNGIANNSNGLGARARRVICPIPDTAANTRPSISTMYIDGYDADNGTNSSDSVLAQVCLTQFNGLGMTCSSYSFASSGTYTGTFDTPIGADAINLLHNASYGDWYANLMVQIPQQGVYGQSQFFGFTTF